MLIGAIQVSEAVSISKHEKHSHKDHKGKVRYLAKNFSAPYQFQDVQYLQLESQKAACGAGPNDTREFDENCKQIIMAHKQPWSTDGLEFMDNDDYVGSAPITYIPPKSTLQREVFDMEDK